MMILDSSVWVALYNEVDSQHAKAMRVARSFADIIVPEYILLETSSLLRFKAGKAVADRFLEYALDNAEVTVLYSSPEFLRDTIHLFRTLKNEKLSFVDASLLYLSRQYDVITFDNALEKEIGKRRKT